MSDKDRYLDQNGLPGTIGEDGTFDGGDTAAILGTCWFFGELSRLALPITYEEPPLRHPDGGEWYGQDDRFSRDQLIAILCGLVADNEDNHEGASLETLLLYWAHKKNWFLTAWNTRGNGRMDAPKKFPDVTGPEVWALWIRIFKPKIAKLILPILDLELLVSAVHWRFFRKDRVTRNHMLSLLACNRVMPTITSRLALKLSDMNDLITRWEGHCTDVREYPTADLFREYLKGEQNGR